MKCCRVFILNKIINAILLFLPPFFMSCTQRSKTFSMYTKDLFLKYCSQISKTSLEMAYGREVNIQLMGNSSGGHSCSQHANCTLPQNLRHLWHYAVWSNCTKWPFIVGILRHTCAKIMLFNHIRYATPVRWMDYLGKGEVLTNTDLDRFVNNIWDK